MGQVLSRGLGKTLLSAAFAVGLGLALSACEEKKEEQAAEQPAQQESTATQPAAQPAPEPAAAPAAQPADTQTAATAPASGEAVLTRGFGASPDTLDPHMNFGAREG